MNPHELPFVLIVPGLRDHVAEHWQTHLASQLSKVRTVSPLEHDKLSREARINAIENTLAEIDAPVLIVAHSAGCMMVAHWAAESSRPILGALLVTPSDMETPMPPAYPTVEQLHRNNWLPIPRKPLPFKSIVAASSNDPLCKFERAQGFSRDWGSRFIDLGPVGHLNPASGYGEWSYAHELIHELISA